MTDISQYRFLPLTLSMETLGGIAVPLVKRGTPLPTKRKQRFTTAEDNQKAVTVNVYLGESPIAAKNIPVGKIELTDIPDAPRGEPGIDVLFEVDQKCRIRVTATEQKSGKVISSEVEEASTHLTPEKIEEMLRKANDARQEDQAMAQQIEAKNNANSLIHRAEKYLQSQELYGFGNASDKQIEETLASLGLALQEDNVGAIKDKSKRLQELLPAATIGNLDAFYNGDVFSSFFGPFQPRKKRTAQSARDKARTQKTPGSSTKDPPQSEEIVKSKEGVFAAGQYFDAKRVVRDLFAQAGRDIVIIDAYVGEDVLSLLTVKRDGVSVKLLTGKVAPAFLALARDFNRQYRDMEIRSSKAFHDRFIFIDDRDFYHFGASLEHLGNKTFMFSKLEEPAMISALKKQWAKEWGLATVVL